MRIEVMIGVFVSLAFIFGFFLGKTISGKSHADLIGQIQEYKQVSFDLASLQVEYKKQSNVLAEYQKQLAKPTDSVVSVSKTTFSVKGKKFSTKTQKIAEVYLADGEKYGPPLGYVDGEISKAYDHDIEIIQGVERDPKTGRFKVLARGFYILKESDSSWKDKKFPLSITGGEVIVDPNIGEVGSKKLRFGPRLTAGIEFLDKDFLAVGTVQMFGYGVNKDFSDYKFLGVGISGNNKKGIHLISTPIIMNMNKFIKPLRNTYIGPVFDFNSKADFGLGLTLQLGL